MSFIFQTIFLAILLCLSGFFSGSETALTSLGKLRTKRLLMEIDQTDSGFAENLQFWLKNSQKVLISILIWNNLVNITASSMATVLVFEILREVLLVERSLAFASGVAVGIMTFLILLFGEITPKSYAEANAESVARRILPLIIFFTRLISPVIVILLVLSGAIVRLLGGKIKPRQNKITEEELKKLVLAGRQEGTLQETELKMLHSVFEFDETVVREIMVPRTEVVALEVDAGYQETLNLARSTGLSRIPVYEERLDNIVGILNIKDLLTRFDQEKAKQFELRKIARPPYFVPETKRVNKLLANFRQYRVHMAIVVDEYGGTSGVITLEDLLEEIVGEIEDEYDEQPELINQEDEQTYVIDARIDLDDLEEQIGLSLPTRRYDSLGGMLIERLGKIPTVGDEIVYEGNQYEVIEATRRQVKRVRLSLSESSQKASGDGLESSTLERS